MVVTELEELEYNSELLAADFIVDGRDVLPNNYENAKWAWRDPSKIKGMVFHQSLEERGSASGNARYHSGPNHIDSDGLPGLSYTLFVEPNGRCYLANGVTSKTYSQGCHSRPGDENAEFISVCFGGNFSGPGYEGSQEPTGVQLEVAVKLWRHVQKIWNWGDDCLYGHSDFGKPACPGNSFMKLVNTLRPPMFLRIQERQELLSVLGYYRELLDGIWGPKSKAALIRFQTAEGLQADGVWGRQTSLAARDVMLG